jgi:Na+-translocating ferredoxin:NAD+ oxidoreductase RnfD subunit
LPVTQASFLTIAAFGAPVIWLVGAVLLLKRSAFGWFLASTFLFGMMFAELSHFVSPLMDDSPSYYSPGMYTAILPIAAGWLTFRIVVREMGIQRIRNRPGAVVAAHRRGR